MADVNAANLTVIAKCLFVAAMFGVFGGNFKKVEPVVQVPLTRVIDYEGNTYEVGYDITATQADDSQWSNPRVQMQGQPRFSIGSAKLTLPKVDIAVPQPIMKFLPKER